MALWNDLRSFESAASVHGGHRRWWSRTLGPACCCGNLWAASVKGFERVKERQGLRTRVDCFYSSGKADRSLEENSVGQCRRHLL